MTVAELFDRVLPRLKHVNPTMDFIDACQAVQDVITRRLWEKYSDLLRDPWESSSQAVSTSTVDLPVDFLGVADIKRDPPYLTYTDDNGDTQVATLLPLSVPRSSYATADAAIPKEYEIRGPVIEIFPTSSVAFTLYLSMYRRPAGLTSMDDELPWNGTFDQLFQDTVVFLSAPNGTFAYVSPMVEQAIRMAVDSGSGLRTGRRIRWLWA